MIDVIIPVFNSEKTIQECLYSVLLQTRIDLIDSIIVVDDCSTDNSHSVLLALAADYPKIKIVHSHTNLGAAESRNIGIRLSNSEYIAFLDSDDYWVSSKIQLYYDILRCHDPVIAIGSVHGGYDISFFWRRKNDVSKVYPFDFLLRPHPATSSLLVHRTTFVQLGMFNSSHRYAEDMYILYKIVRSIDTFLIHKNLSYPIMTKRLFGERGLSANMEKMYKGELRNLRLFLLEGYINYFYYFMLRLYYGVKYFRRILIAKWMGFRNG